jgi:chromosome segregation ATPase
MATEDTKMPAIHSVDNDGHELRLQNLEQLTSDIKTDVAQNKLSLQYVAKEVQDGFSRFSSHLDHGFNSIQKRLDEGEDRMTAMSERMGENRRHIDDLVDDKKKAAAKWDSWKKLVTPAITGAVAIALKELVTLLIHHL